jgi:hypothetical protein
MRVAVYLLFCIPFLISVPIFAQKSAATAAQPAASAVTVPLVLDHNRIVVDADISTSGSTAQRVRAWVDNGDPEFWMSQRVARLMGFDVNCDGQACTGKPGAAIGELSIHGFGILLPAMGGGVKVLPGVAAPGMNAEIHISSTILRGYDVLVDFPGRKFSIGPRGSLRFDGTKTKAAIDSATGLIRIPSQIENKKYELGLDLGSSMSTLSKGLFDKLSGAHPDWPKMTGGVGPANSTGSGDELKQRLLRLDRLQFGPLFLVDVAVADSAEGRISTQGTEVGSAASGALGSEALLNYRIGLDYAHSAVYFEIGRTFNFPDFDVIGLTLRPEADGRFTVAAIADFHGEPSVLSGVDGVQVGDSLLAVDDIPTAGSTMGQVWAMLGGEIGQQRRLTLERDGKRFVLLAKVQHFLGRSTAKSTASDRSVRPTRANYFPNTSCSRVWVVAGSKLSLTSTVSPFSSMTTVPSSVVQIWRPERRTFNSASAASSSAVPAWRVCSARL